VVLEKEVEIVKVYRQRAIRIAHLSFQLRWAKNKREFLKLFYKYFFTWLIW
jgi:hypothetical protein